MIICYKATKEQSNVKSISKNTGTERKKEMAFLFTINSICSPNNIGAL